MTERSAGLDIDSHRQAIYRAHADEVVIPREYQLAASLQGNANLSS